MNDYLEIARLTLQAMQDAAPASEAHEFEVEKALSDDSPAISWPEWKAASLNKLFREQGITGQPGRITAATVRHGEIGRERVDSVARDERPMSPAEVTE